MGEENGQDVGREKIDRGFLVALGVSYTLGVGFGLGGRATANEWVLPAIPPSLDLVGGGLGHGGGKRALCYIVYGLGVATSHADRIYQLSKTFLENF